MCASDWVCFEMKEGKHWVCLPSDSKDSLEEKVIGAVSLWGRASMQRINL